MNQTCGEWHREKRDRSNSVLVWEQKWNRTNTKK